MRQNKMRYQLWVVLFAMLFCVTTAKAADNGTVMIKEAAAGALTHATIKVNGTEVAVNGTSTATGTVTLLIEDKSGEDYLLTDASVAIKTYTTEAAQGRTRSGATPNYLGTITATPDANQKGKYTFAMPDNSLNVEVTINVTAKQVALTGVPATYTGSAITPGVQIGGITAGSGDFSMECTNNINAGTNTASATITGAGNYWGTVTKTFTINPSKIASVVLDRQSFVFQTGVGSYSPTVTTVRTEDGQVFEGTAIDATFDIGGTTSATAANNETSEGSGEYETNALTVTPKSGTNYDTASPYTANWQVIPAGLNSTDDFVFTFDEVTYTGNALTPSFTIKHSNTNEIVPAENYEIISWANNTNSGVETATVTIKGKKVGDVQNYTGTRTQAFTINKAEVTVTPVAKTITYGDEPADGGVEYSGFDGFNANVVSGAPTLTTNYTQYGNAGSYNITVTADANNVVTGMSADNFKFVAGDGTDKLTVNKATLNVSASDNTITYGDAPAGNGVTYDGFKGTDTQSVVSGTPTYTYTYAQYGNVGTYKITYHSGLTATNYDFAAVNDSGTLTVNQKEVDLTWSTDALTYDGNPQAPTATATGTVNSDAITVTVTGQQINAGTGYTATASALTGEKKDNYKLPTANTHTFDIGKAAGSIEYTTTSVQKLFGDAVFTNSLDLEGDGTVTYTSSTSTVAMVDEFGAISITGDGTTTITATVTDKEGGNYHYSTPTTDGTATAQYSLTVGALTIASTNTPYSNVYDGAAHRINVAVTYPEDFSDGGTIQYSDDGGLNWSEINPEKKNVGTYTIYYKLSKTGYTTVTHHSTITITPAPLTITADNKGITYGSLPDYTVTYGEDNGSTNYFVNGETETVLGGTLAYICDYTAQYQDRGTGSFSITPSGLTSSNYDITFVAGTLTVNPKEVTLNWGTEPIVLVSNDIDAKYPIPTFGSGEIVNDDAVSVSIAVTDGTNPVAEPTAVGEYTATASLAGPKAANYTFATSAVTSKTYSIKRQLEGVTFSGDKNWVTYFASEDLAIPEGIIAYRISAVNGTTVTAEQVDYINANTGVLLYKSGTPAMPLLAGSYTGTNTDYTSLLKGGNFAEGRNYILYGDEFVIYDGTAAGPGNFRCYLPAADATAAARYRSLSIVIGGSDGTTSIDGTSLKGDSETDGTEWYDLQGRKLNGKPTKAGLYINNGKKIFVK